MHAIAFNWNRWENTLNWIVKTLNAAQFVLMIFDGGKNIKSQTLIVYDLPQKLMLCGYYRFGGTVSTAYIVASFAWIKRFLLSAVTWLLAAIPFNWNASERIKQNVTILFRIRWISSAVEWRHLGKLQSNFNYLLHCRSCSMFMCIGSFDNKIDKWFKMRIASIEKCFMQQPE